MTIEPLSSPLRIGDFQIVREIGRGGMGVVYEARQASLNRRVALKVILGINRSNRQVVERFRREAASAAKLTHPNIVQVFAYGESDGQQFIAMEFVEGSPLERLLRQRSGAANPLTVPSAESTSTVRLGDQVLSPSTSVDVPAGSPLRVSAPSGPGDRPEATETRRLLRILIAASRGLHAAHEAGLLHRDIKPANILVDLHDVAKIADFGLARTEAAGDTLTLSGEVMGTLAYMSPEQLSASREAITRRSDIYALGVTLYEIIAGRRPYEETSTHLMIQRIQTDDPVPPSRHNPDVPCDLEVICLKAMERNPERRYATAAEFGDDLEHFLRDEPILARPAGTLTRIIKFVRRRRVSVGITALVVVAAVIIGWQLVRSQANDKQLARSKLESSLMRAIGGQPSDVLPLLDEAQQLDPSLVEVYLQRGLVQFNTDQPDRALAEFDRGLKIAPNDAALRFARGTVLRFMGREAEAKTVLESAKIEGISDPVRLTSLGIFLVTNGRSRDAAEAFEKAKQLNPTWPQSRFGLALANFRLRRFQKATEILQSFLDLDPNHVIARTMLVSMGYSQIREADRDERAELVKSTKETLAEALKLAPDEPLIGAVAVAMESLDTTADGNARFDAALRTVENELKQQRADRVRVSANIVYEMLALTVLDRDPVRSRAYAEEALRIRKGSEGARFVLARLDERDQKWKEAAENYRSILRDYPQAPLAPWRLLAIHLDHPEIVSKEEAENFVDVVFELEPQDPEILVTTARVAAEFPSRTQQARKLFTWARTHFARLGNERRLNDVMAAMSKLPND